MITKRSKKRGLKTRNDKKSLALFWITIPLGLSIGFFTANYQKWDLLNQSIALVGLGVFMTGMMIRWISIIQLNKEFTVDVVITTNHQLKTDGIYKSIRHPSYLGLLFICFGLSVAMNSYISLFVITIPVLLVIIYRIKIEEDILMKEFGQPYKDYVMKTHKMIPKLY
jgi:protein-S-isoprenylcysteine O-methyltransferase Ste14